MNEIFELYESVKITKLNETGVIVSIDIDKDTKLHSYLIEKDDEYKTGDCKLDLVWCNDEEIEKYEVK